jgi:8-oxo-dGTP pyrophosphatase MutT (NUDIX family)
MATPQIRPLTICLFRHNNRILVAEGHDPTKGETFYRPLGGGIEFGEYAQQALVRELREEIGAEIAELRYLFTLENIFTYAGNVGHEIVLVHDGRLVNHALYQQPEIVGHETNGEAFVIRWKELSEFAPGGAILYPDGLWERLQTI